MKKAVSVLTAICLLIAALPMGAFAAQVGVDVSGFSSVTVFGGSVGGHVFENYGVSIVMYWATWNYPAREQMLIMQQIHEEHPEYGVFAALHVDGTSTAEEALEFIAAHGISFTVFIADSVWEGVASEASFIPQTFIVNRYCVIVEAWQASFADDEILLETLDDWYEPLEPIDPTADGDADLSGAVDSADALYVLRCVMGLAEYGELNLAHGDVNLNGELDSGDALMILRAVSSIG
jgi:hypothetical protein